MSVSPFMKASRSLRQMIEATFLTVKGDQHAGGNGTVGLDDLDGFAHGGAGGDHVVDDHDLALERGADDHAAFAVVLGFLAVEGPGHVAAEAGEIHGHGGGQRDALVGGPEDHVELDAAGVAGSQKRLRVELAEAVEQGTGVEEAGVEEVRRETAGLGLELAEAKDVGFQGKFDELFLNRLHDCFFKREKEVARPRGIVWHCTAKPRYP